jgi:DNA invertase Pin-like site-specific DNA recombinase
LGLEAQRKAVADYLNGSRWRLAAEFTEVESGKHANRPALLEALRACRIYGARLVIAKLDRLSRDAHFLLGLEKAGVDFVAADMPHANRLTVGVMAMVADEERRAISRRTKEALAANRAWYARLTDEERAALIAAGKALRLGGQRGASITADARQTGLAARQARASARAADLRALLAALRQSGATSLGSLAAALNDRGVPAARGGRWSKTQVRRLLLRLEDLATQHPDPGDTAYGRPGNESCRAAWP